MMIKYKTCGGNEGEEEVLKIEFGYVFTFFSSEDWVPKVFCTKLNGDEFEVDFDKVVEISS